MSAHDHAQGALHGSRRDYVQGFFLSVILTAVSFWLVMGNVTHSKPVISILIVALAAVQMVVHVVFFLHVRAKSERGWTLLSLIFTLVLVVIALAGSLWVMNHLDSNMMPGQDISQLP
jgi:cytochrome o ubiquinol oxidase operon protein cyoD